MFTPSELLAIQALKDVSKATYWGEAVYRFLQTNFTRQEFSDLVKSLKDQNADSPETMQDILGPAYRTIIDL